MPHTTGGTYRSRPGHRRPTVRGTTKVKKVMGEFKRGTLRSSSGAKVASRQQAVAIGLSEQRRLEKKISKIKGY